MELFIDTANIEEIKEIAQWGLLSGVTTNPSLIAKEGKDFKEVVTEITNIVSGPISAEVNSPTWEEMVKEGIELSKIHENIVIKVPMTEQGLIAVSHFKKKGISTNVTLIFSVSQALLAASAGATYVSPFIGRVDDISWDGMDLIADIAYIFKSYSMDCKIIAASVRHPLHVVDSAKAGAHIATIPYGVFKKMVLHPLTDQGIQKFEADWEKYKKEVK
ncbi:MAG: fructose-6-phosphate aldolase [Tissierellia bacterium]|nr:fructose-6-phosphate aldolase [Tissierellia bacterium]